MAVYSGFWQGEREGISPSLLQRNSTLGSGLEAV